MHRYCKYIWLYMQGLSRFHFGSFATSMLSEKTVYMLSLNDCVNLGRIFMRYRGLETSKELLKIHRRYIAAGPGNLRSRRTVQSSLLFPVVIIADHPSDVSEFSTPLLPRSLVTSAAWSTCRSPTSSTSREPLERIESRHSNSISRFTPHCSVLAS